MKVFLFTILLPLTLVGQSTLGRLAPLVGVWEGTATAYYPREKGKEPRIETVQAECKRALKGTYVECLSTWTSQAGNNRELRTFFNFDKRQNFYDILYLYDNWPGKVNYALYFDQKTKTFSGQDYFMAEGNTPAEEKVTWQISEDGKTVTSIEYNHYENEKPDYWPKTFEFTWKKVE